MIRTIWVGFARVLIGALLAACSSSPAVSTAGLPTSSTRDLASGAPSSSPTGPPSQAVVQPTQDPRSIVGPGESWIAFQTQTMAGYGVHLIRPDGTGLHRWPAAVPGTQEHPVWSPDGQRMLVNSIQADTTEDLWMANVDGTDKALVLDCIAPCAWTDEPAWSPDGRTIAFQRATLVDGRLRSTLELLDVATGSTKVVVTMPDREVVLAPRWAPDGRRLVVEVAHLPEATLEAEPDGDSVGTVDLDATTPKVHRLLAFDTFANNPDWSPIDDLLLFSRPIDAQHQFADLVVARPDGSGERVVTDFAKHGGAAVQPAFTPDGKQVLFVLKRPGQQETVMAVINLDGTGLAPATGSNYRDGFHPRSRPMP